jgi:ribosomal protein L11 methyltransferase
VLVSELAQVVFSVPASAAEAVGNLLTEEGGGVEQRDSDVNPALPAATVELVVWLSERDVERRVQQVEKLLGSLKEMGLAADPWSWRSTQVDPKSWLEAYKRYFKVNRIGRYFVIKPSWESHTPGPSDLMIEMDPGMAFGTGLHASTRLVMHILERVARTGPAPQSVLDLGCGTGILSIAAARLWSGCRVTAVDNDEQATQVCRENVQRNGLESRIHVELRSGAKVDGRHHLVLANLSAETLTELQGRLHRNVEPYGRLVLSGLLAEQARAISILYCKTLVFEPEFSEELEGWQSLLLRARD